MTRAASLKTGVLAALLALSTLGMTACGTPSTQTETSSETTQETSGADKQDEYARALSGKGIVNTFIGEPFYDGTIKDENDAFDAIDSVTDRIGADETTMLDCSTIRPTESGNTYYTFNQQAGDVEVHGATVKLIVDKDGKAIGLVSAILPNVQIEDLGSWACTQEQAEQVVLEHCAAEGAEETEVVKDATEQTVIPLTTGTGTYRYVWAVYTLNYDESLHAGYLAHYVSEDGDYLYAIGIDEPSNESARAGDAAAFPFASMEEGTWSGTVTKQDGSKKKISVPTLTDPETGNVYLADGKRKILCADYASFAFRESLVPRTISDKEYSDKELLVYDTFIRVWDFYDSIGWTGPDSSNTPSLLLMNMVNEDGEVVRNAYYQGRWWGFQTFAFNSVDPDGECTDVIAHEFTHCVTSSTMTANLYQNDPGAINEGMSDIMGNLVEMLIDNDPDGAWLIGENELGDEPYRSMKDPRTRHQPEYTWDMYYGPAVTESSSHNDYGGVHTNSSLLNIISYKLDQAGMQPDDQFYFWMNVALAMTPLTDYPQMTELLPWCMNQSGYPQYVDALNKALDEASYTKKEFPSTLPEGAGVVSLQLPDNVIADSVNLDFWFAPADKVNNTSEYIHAWAETDTGALKIILPAGDYYFLVSRYENEVLQESEVLAKDSWVVVETGIADDGKPFTVTAGETIELSADGLDK